MAGTCQAGFPLDCDDFNVCTTDTCNPATGCVFSPNANSCDDGDVCTTGDVCSAGSCVPGPFVCEPGAIAHYKLDSPGNPIIDSVGSNDGTNTGATFALGAAPGLGNSLDFDGEGDQVVLLETPLTGTGDFSIFAWVNTTHSGSRKAIVNYGTTEGAYLGHDNEELYLFMQDDGQLRFDLRAHGGPVSGVTINDGRWHSVGVVHASGTVQLYVDGDATGSPVAMSPAIVDGDGQIGADGLTDGASNDRAYWSGKIDDVKIWDRALSAGEIADSYGSLIAHYRLDEMGGPVVDSVGANDGTNFGATRGVPGRSVDAFEFDGFNSRIDTLATGDIPSVGTISLWLNPDTTVELANQVFGSVEDASCCKDGYIGNWYKAENRLGFKIYQGNATDGYIFTSDGSVPPGVWTHVVVTIDAAASVKIYVNGALDTTGTQASLAIVNDRALMFGDSILSENLGFEGRIDEISIWDRVLSDSEVLAIYEDMLVAHQVPALRGYSRLFLAWLIGVVAMGELGRRAKHSRTSPDSK